MNNSKENTKQQNKDEQYGEGNYTAGKEYQRGATKTARSGTEQAAREARRAMQNPKQREELEEAADRAKQGRP